MTRHTALLLGSALAVRLMGIGAAAIWFDESVSRYRAMMPLAMYLVDSSDYVGANVWEMVLRLFAIGPVWLFRVPSLIVAVAALWIGWRTTSRLAFTHAQQVTAAIPMILLPGLIWQAQDARYYAALTMLYAAAIYFAATRRGLGLLACVGILPYVHPIGAVYAAAALVVGWIAGMQWTRLARISLIVLVAWIPRIYSLLWPPGERQAFWLGQLTVKHALAGTVQAFMTGTIDNGPAIALLGLLLAAIVVAAFKVRHRSARVLLAAAVLPIVSMLLISLVKPIYFYRPLQPVLIPFCLLIGLTLAPGRRWFTWIGAGIGATVLLAGIVCWDPSARGSHIDAGAGFIESHWRAGDEIAHAAATTAVPFSFYTGDRESCMLEGYGPDRLPSNLILPYCEGVGSWLVWSRDETIMRPDLSARLRTLTAGRLPVWRSDYAWQMAPMEIYYLGEAN